MSLPSTYDDLFQQAIAQCVGDGLERLLKGHPLPGAAQIRASLLQPPRFALGQGAFPCFSFAKLLGKAPQQAAQSLVELLPAHPLISRAEAAGGYANFFCSWTALGGALRAWGDQRLQCPLIPEEEREKIVVEFSQPNTHKALHVGHLRGLVLGDALCRILEAAGHQVVRTTFPGDVGAHVGKALWFMGKVHGRPQEGEDRSAWLGDIYARADAAFQADKGTPQEAENRKEIARINRQVESGGEPEAALWKETRQWSLQTMEETYAWLGVPFDRWYFESECAAEAKDLVERYLARGLFQESEGAIGIDLEEEGLGFAMVRKGDGDTPYLTKDLVLMGKKFEDPAVTSSIYVVDSRQKLHFSQVFAIAQRMGFGPASKSIHLPYETVNGPDGAPLSSRSLNGIPLQRLRADMERTVLEGFLGRYEGQWSQEAREETARQVAIGAMKYGMIRMDNNTVLHFQLDDWLQFEGETGPYLQYVRARCTSILSKLGHPPAHVAFDLPHEAEQELLFDLWNFPASVRAAARTRKPHLVAGQLFSLAKTFNRFYEKCPVRTAERETVRTSRLALVEETARVMGYGLGLLGIPAPEQM